MKYLEKEARNKLNKLKLIFGTTHKQKSIEELSFSYEPHFSQMLNMFRILISVNFIHDAFRMARSFNGEGYKNTYMYTLYFCLYGIEGEPKACKQLWPTIYGPCQTVVCFGETYSSLCVSTYYMPEFCCQNKILRSRTSMDFDSSVEVELCYEV